MTGAVDANGRAIINVEIAPTTPLGEPSMIQAWIDTGFTGELVVPQVLIDRLSLSQSGTVLGVLADGSNIELETFSCLVHWFDEDRELEVIANDGDHALLGVGMLLNHRLEINYRTGEILVD